MGSILNFKRQQNKMYNILVSRKTRNLLTNYWISPPEVFLGKGALKISSKFTGEHLCQRVISIKLLSKFIEITLRHGCSPVNLVHIFRKPFRKNTSGGLLLKLVWFWLFMWSLKYLERIVQCRIKNPVKYLLLNFFVKIVKGF